MSAKNGTKKPSIKVKDLRAAKEPKGGGRKHLAGVKYEDITVNCTTNTTK